MNRLAASHRLGLLSLTSLGLMLAASACGDSPRSFGLGSGGGAGVGGVRNGSGGRESAAGAGAAGGHKNGAGGDAGASPETGGRDAGISGSGSVAGAPGAMAGSASGGSSPIGNAGSSGIAGHGGSSGAGGGKGTAGSSGTAGGGSGGTGAIGGNGAGGSGGAIVVASPPQLVTSGPSAYWKTDGAVTDSTAAANVTVNDATTAQQWDGMGAAFNELGWKYLNTTDMQNKAIGLLFSASDGANFAWGRVPIGASDYADGRYTPEDTTGADPAPDATESNRPAADNSLSKFSLDRDKLRLIPYIKAAQAVKPDLRFWASPWTPPIWMKTGYKKNSGADSSASAKKASYYDGGNMKSDATTLAAYAQYFSKFVQGYKDQGINIELVSPQNEPGYDQNYPSCLWDKTTYTTFIGSYLGPAMKTLGVKVMLGTLSNDNTDFNIAAGPVADATAKSFLSVVGAQWNTLDATKLNQLGSGLPFWATEHKCGNYPWNPSGYPAYNSTQAPNDQAYAVESWGYIRDAIRTVKVTSYNAWNMVLDKSGLGIDTTRDWKQNALLVADGGVVTVTPAYYVFRHISQFVNPGATVVGTTGGDAIAFKNPDGSLVAVMFNNGAANAAYVVAIGGKKYAITMPASGWATIKYKP